MGSVRIAAVGMISKKEYKELKDSLSAEDKATIDKLEKDCNNLKVGFWEFFRHLEAYKVGRLITPEIVAERHLSPMRKMRDYLYFRAAEKRGIKLIK